MFIALFLLLGITVLTGVVSRYVLAGLTPRFPERACETRIEGQNDAERGPAGHNRKEPRSELMDSQFRAILDQATDVICCVSKTGRLLDVNAAVERVVGFKPEECIGKYFFRLAVIRSRDIPQLIRLFRQTIRSRTITEFVELELRHKNGQPVFIEIGSKFVMNNGKIQCIVNIIRNISERKLAIAELTKAKQQAESASRAKSQFLANMSHEIRTPMTAILGFTDVLIDSLSDPDSLDAVNTIKRNGEYLLGILNDILDLSKIEAGKLQIERDICSPIHIVNEVTSLLQVRANAKNLFLRAEYIGPIPRTIVADPIRVRQILVNLIGNAIKFTKTGGIRLVTSLDHTKENQPKLRFDVVDTGIGMNDQQISMVFQPFVQCNRETDGKPSGTGLGLTITKRLVEMLGGEIWVQSDPKVGSTFSVTIDAGCLDRVEMIDGLANIPVTKDDGQNAQAEACSYRKLDCRILLAEDGPDNARLISLLLRKSGAEVKPVGNGRLAVEAALDAERAGRPFDIVLMDMQMPDMNGYEAVKKLRDFGYSRPIIALTANAMKEDRQKCLDVGCNNYLTKPIDREKLLQVVGTHTAKTCPTDERATTVSN